MAPSNLKLMLLILLGAASLGACAAEPPAPAPYAAAAAAPAAAMIPAPPPFVPPPPTHGFPPPPAPDGLLSAPPADAQPGACFAKVTVRGAMITPPPPPPHAFWVMTPARPGDIGPTFCLYFAPGAPPPPTFAPNRTGWIRVVCDRDLTATRVRGVQRRLSRLGLYRGPAHGRYDAETARAVARFQQNRGIPHGGYLSLETMRALEGSARRQAYAAPAALPPAPAALPLGAFAGPMIPPGLPPGAIVLPAPCRAAPCGPIGHDPGSPPYAGFLSWPGKSLY